MYIGCCFFLFSSIITGDTRTTCAADSPRKVWYVWGFYRTGTNLLTTADSIADMGMCDSAAADLTETFLFARNEMFRKSALQQVLMKWGKKNNCAQKFGAQLKIS